MTRRWLITGATGLLALDLIAVACNSGNRVTTTSRSGGDKPCDLADPLAVRGLVEAAAPDVVVHAAGLTDVDGCQRVPDRAVAANRDTAANLAAALPSDARLVFISTDQVYPDVQGPHVESDTGPVNVYGQSKLEGERAALIHPNALVLRTNFFGSSRQPGRESLSDFVIRSLTQRKPVTFFADLFFSPLHMATLAGLIVELVDRGLTGVYNAGCRGGDSKAKFAFAVADHKGLQTETAHVGSSDVPSGRAPRARDLRLDVTKLETILGRPMPTLREEIGKL